MSFFVGIEQEEKDKILIDVHFCRFIWSLFPLKINFSPRENNNN